MKLTNSIKAIIITTLVLNATFAQADERSTCGEFGVVAADIMTKRQNNANISNVMNDYSSHKDADKLKALVAIAYQKKAYKTLVYQQLEINKFSNSMMVICYKIRVKKGD